MSTTNHIFHNNPNTTLALQWNICGLRKNYNELKLLINQHNPIIICLQETMLNANSFNLSGYDTIIKPDSNSSSHRGVGCCIKTGTPYKVINITSELAVIAVELAFPIRATFLNIYIFHQMNTTQLIQKLNDIIRQINTPIIFMGDFNAFHTLWGSRVDSLRGKALLKFFNTNGLTLLNTGASTRICHTTGIVL